MVGWIFTAAQTNDNVSSGFNKADPSDSLHQMQPGAWVLVKRQSSVSPMTFFSNALNVALTHPGLPRPVHRWI